MKGHTNAGENVEEKEPFPLQLGNVEWPNPSGTQSGSSSDNQKWTYPIIRQSQIHRNLLGAYKNTFIYNSTNSCIYFVPIED